MGSLARLRIAGTTRQGLCTSSTDKDVKNKCFIMKAKNFESIMRRAAAAIKHILQPYNEREEDHNI